MKKGLIYVIFAREPVAGKVKSRLARDIGDTAAVRLYEAFLKDAISAVSAAGQPFAVAYTPESNAGYFPAIAPGAVEHFPQKGGDLGSRMKNASDRFFALGYGKVGIVGSDIPLLRTRHLREAASALDDNQVVIGPCRDGGYYLIGLSGPSPELFEGVDWGSDRVLEQTLATIQRQGYRVHILPELLDVDTVEDLRHLTTA